MSNNAFENVLIHAEEKTLGRSLHSVEVGMLKRAFAAGQAAKREEIIELSKTVRWPKGGTFIDWLEDFHDAIRARTKEEEVI